VAAPVPEAAVGSAPGFEAGIGWPGASARELDRAHAPGPAAVTASAWAWRGPRVSR